MNRACLFGGLGIVAVALGACGGSAFTSSADSGDAGSTEPPDALPGNDGRQADDADAGTTWCANQNGATFCADFDEAPTVQGVLGAWTGETSDGGGALDLTSGSDVPSPPNALRATAADNQYVFVAKAFPTMPASIHVDVALRVDHGDVNGFLVSSVLMAVFFGPTQTDGNVYLSLASGSLNVGVVPPADAGALPDVHAIGPAPTVGQWGHYGVDITTDANAHVQVSHDGVPIGPAVGVPPALRNPSIVTLALGAYDYGATGLVEASFDNVRVEIH